MIKAIIFDFAGVIGTEGYSLWTREKKDRGIESKSTFFNDMSEAVDRGDISSQEFSRKLAEKAGMNPKDVKEEIFNKIKINHDLLDMILKLKKKYKIVLLTNYNYIWMNELIVKYQLKKYFNLQIISSFYKTIKPEKEIYLITLNLLKIKPDEAIFIDDRQRNVDGGEAVGIKSFLFTTNQKLREDLRNDGVDF